jgi:hypothetical protein
LISSAALLHVLALKTPEAEGERILAVADSARFSWQDHYDYLNAASYKGVPTGKKGAGVHARQEKKGQTMSNAKSKKIFPGFKYRVFKESVLEMGADLKRIGVLQ